MYRDNTLSKWQRQNWFKKFIGGDFVVTDKQLSDRPVEIDDKEFKEIIDTNRHSTTCNI